MSNIHSDYEQVIAMAPETTFAAVATIAAIYALCNSDMPQLVQPNLKSAGLYSRARTKNDYVQGRKSIAGDLMVELRYGNPAFEMLMRHAIGKVSETGDVTTGFVRAYAPTNDELTAPSFTIWADKALTNGIIQYVGCKVNTVGLSWEDGGIIVGTFGIIANDATNIASALTMAAPTDELGAAVQNTELLINGATVPFYNFTMQINNNYRTGKYREGQRTEREPKKGPMEVTGSFTVDTESLVYANAIENMSNQTFSIKTIGDISVALDVGTTNNYIEFTATNLFYTGEDGRIPQLADEQQQTLPFELAEQAVGSNLFVMSIQSNASIPY